MKQNIGNHRQNNPVVLNERYLLKSVLHKGEHSTIFDVIDLENEQSCIVKMVILERQTDEEKVLTHLQGRQGFIKLLQHGQFQSQYRYQILEKCGPSIKFWFKALQRQFSLQTIASIVIRLLSILSELHSLCYIHCNLNLACILTSLTDDKELKICDFQFAVKFVVKNDGIRVPQFKPRKQCKYSSLGSILGTRAFPRDDLESLMYIMCDLLSEGKLFKPLQKRKPLREKLFFYQEVKQNFLAERILRAYPECFLEFANRVKFLNPNEWPINYDQLKQPLKQFVKQNKLDYTFDWNVIKNKVIRSAPTSIRQSTQSFQEDDLQLRGKRFKDDLETIMEKSQEMWSTMQQASTALEQAVRNGGDEASVNLPTEESCCDIECDEPTERSELPHFYQKNF